MPGMFFSFFRRRLIIMTRWSFEVLIEYEAPRQLEVPEMANFRQRTSPRRYSRRSNVSLIFDTYVSQIVSVTENF